MVISSYFRGYLFCRYKAFKLGLVLLVVLAGILIYLCCFKSSRHVRLETLDGRIQRIAYRADGNQVVVAARTYNEMGQVVVIDREKGTVEKWRTHAADCMDVAFCGNQVLATYDTRENHVILWSNHPTPNSRFLEGHQDEIVSSAICPTGKYFITGGFDGDVIIWNAQSGALLTRLRHPWPVTALAISSAENYVISGTGNVMRYDGRKNEVLLWDISEIEEPKRFAIGCHKWGWIHAAAVSNSGKSFMTASDDGSVKMWLAKTRSMAWQTNLDNTIVLCLAFSCDGILVAGGTQSGEVCVWEADTGKVKRFAKCADVPITALAFSPCRYQVCMGTANGEVLIYDAVK